ncbi:acid--CoA ligase [Microbacterium paludicola]|uniref:Acid--CoA ligase n=1 Tax=Microbacterium paludicola TaxID=300019 RepID=A0A4Y9FXL2_9MICO|nr:AMP-binding protein [Microbacterium paludicola]MBF0815284.1 AMP-binding protein [Microbacterium paludicola]TFU34149.1 acid--CoA ligase [Microbacterium paludicola]
MTRLTFSRILRERAMAHPHRRIVSDERGALTARELDRAATSLAHALIRQGVRPDDSVAVSVPNGIDFVIACAGIWRAGGTPQPLDSALASVERAEIERLSAPAAAIGVKPETAGIPWLPTVRVEPDARPLPDLASSCWKSVATSGSTGRPKLVRAAAPALLDPHEPVAPFLPLRATQIVAGPMWHSAVFTYAFRGLLTGHDLIVMSRFDARRWVDLVERHRATWGLLVPTMMSRLLQLPEEFREASRLSTLRAVLHMGAPCSIELKRSFLDWLGPARVDEVYAGSESNGLTHINGLDWLDHPGSVGRGIGGTVVSIRDEHGEDLPTGHAGMIWMHRGASPAYEYIGAVTRRDEKGWDSLADIGHLDPDGYLYLHDRADDLINRGGEKIAPASVEAVLESHPAVLEAVAFGAPDDELGQVVHATVVLSDPNVTADAVHAYAAQRLHARAPTVIHTADGPLRNEAGKIRRSAMLTRSVRNDQPHPAAETGRTAG